MPLAPFCGRWCHSEMSDMDPLLDRARGIVSDISEGMRTQGARLSTWLVLGNGAALAFTLNAAFNGARCGPEVIWNASAAFVVGIAAGFAAVAFSYVGSFVNFLQAVANLRALELIHAGKPATPPKRFSGIMPLPNFILMVLSYVALTLSALAFGWGVCAPIRGGAASLEACAKAPPPAAIVLSTPGLTPPKQ